MSCTARNSTGGEKKKKKHKKKPKEKKAERQEVSTVHRGAVYWVRGVAIVFVCGHTYHVPPEKPKEAGMEATWASKRAGCFNLWMPDVSYLPGTAPPKIMGHLPSSIHSLLAHALGSLFSVSHLLLFLSSSSYTSHITFPLIQLWGTV